MYRKRYPPSLSDEVFRLKDISRGSPRHKRLLDAKVHTVAEFLRLLNMNPHRLKQVKISSFSFSFYLQSVDYVVEITFYTVYLLTEEQNMCVCVCMSAADT